jgi:hypothetical protein
VHVGVNELQVRIERYLQAFKAAFGTDRMIQKFHFALHLPLMLLQFGILLSCFVHERKHKIVKQAAKHMKNTSLDWERSVLNQITSEHFAAFEHSAFHVTVGLRNAHKKPLRLACANATYSSRLIVSYSCVWMCVVVCVCVLCVHIYLCVCVYLCVCMHVCMCVV